MITQDDYQWLFRKSPSMATFIAEDGAYLDVNDRDVSGGAEGRLSTSLNWYPIYNVRFMFDWTRVMNTKGGNFITQTAVGLDILTSKRALPLADPMFGHVRPIVGALARVLCARIVLATDDDIPTRGECADHLRAAA